MLLVTVASVVQVKHPNRLLVQRLSELVEVVAVHGLQQEVLVVPAVADKVVLELLIMKDQELITTVLVVEVVVKMG
jgi:hypothetical protein